MGSGLKMRKNSFSQNATLYRFRRTSRLEAVSVNFSFLSLQPATSGDCLKSGNAGQFLSYWATLLKHITKQTDKTNLSHDGLNPAHDPF